MIIKLTSAQKKKVKALKEIVKLHPPACKKLAAKYRKKIKTAML
jgi:hypothetical protein